MPKPSSHKNKRKETNSHPVLEVPLVPRKQKKDATATIVQQSKEIPLPKAFLIVCEGPTEAAYFEGLCKQFDLRSKFEIEILPQKETALPPEDEFDKYMGSSVKGLLYMAMKEQKVSRVRYDEVWIVTDNDEGNAYKLDQKSLSRIEQVVSQQVIDVLQDNKVPMLVREKEKKKKGERIRYFLSRQEYETFLQSVLTPCDYTDYANGIINNTTKCNDFTQLYSNDAKALFYDNTGKFVTTNKGEVKFSEKNFDENWQKYIKVAYTCISFEHWLLLHFERCKLPFYNSECIIKYFDERDYFDGKFKKGWYLYSNIANNHVKAFFQQVHQAFLNNIWLNTQMQTEIASGKMFYEVNPYSDVFQLTNSLLQVTIAYPNIPLHFRDLNNFCATPKEDTISVSFVFNRKKTVLNRELTSFVLGN